MADKRPARPVRQPADPADLAALATMAQIAERAGAPFGGSSRSASVVGSSPAPQPAAPPPGAGVSSAQLHNARVLLSEQNVVGPTRLRLAKRVVMRGSRLFTHKLVGAGQQLADAIEIVEVTHGQAIGELQGGPGGAKSDLGSRVSKVELDYSRLNNSLHAQLTSVELGVDDVAAAVARTAEDLQDSARTHQANLEATARQLNDNARGLDARLSALERSAEHDRSELHRTRTLVNRLVRTAAQIGNTAQPLGEASTGNQLGGGHELAPASGQSTAAGAAQSSPATLDDSTYVDFEHRFRGTRDEIRARQKDAVPFMADLVGKTAPVVDLGCGRGEWLELLAELGVPAYGVDTNTAMVREAMENGLDARLGDAVAHLEQVPESSLQGVTAFHFVEHIPLDVLVRMLDSALVGLKPGGTLLLETPNPTNLIVGAANFYLDPTHLRVLHPDFLAFLVESRGFVDVQVHYVHRVVEESVLEEDEVQSPEADARLSRVVRNVEWALFGPQDYLLYARRAEVAW